MAHRKLRQRNEDRQCGPLLAPPCAWGDCALAHASGVVAGLAQTFRPRRACDRRRMDPQRSHAPAACEPPHSGAWPLCVFSAKWSAKCHAPPHSGSARAGRQAVLTAVICFGLCASEEWGFAYILRSGIRLVSACMQPDVASGRCVQLRLCPTRLPRGHRKITRSNTKATSDLHSQEDQQIMQSHDNTAKAHIGAES